MATIPPSFRRTGTWGTGAWPWIVLLLGVAVFGFWKPYFARLGAAQALTHLHAAAMLAWIGMLVAQPLLMRARRRAWHRWLGRASYVVVPLIAITALALAQTRIRAAPPQALAFQQTILYLGVSGTAMLLTVWGLGVLHRRDPALHARYMAGTALTLLDPVLARILIFWVPSVPPPLYVWINYGVIYAILGLLIWRDRHSTRGRSAFFVLLALFAVLQVSILTVPGTAAWQRFALWYAAL